MIPWINTIRYAHRAEELSGEDQVGWGLFGKLYLSKVKMRPHISPNPCNKEEYMYPAVLEVISLEDFSLMVVLDTGERGLLDMKPYLDFGVFKKIRDYEKFKKVRVAFDTIEWDEGVDLDPEFIYAKSKPAARAA